MADEVSNVLDLGLDSGAGDAPSNIQPISSIGSVQAAPIIQSSVPGISTVGVLPGTNDSLGAAIGADPELEEIKKKVKEMEAEAAKLADMQKEVELAMEQSTSSGVQNLGALDLGAYFGQKKIEKEKKLEKSLLSGVSKTSQYSLFSIRPTVNRHPISLDRRKNRGRRSIYLLEWVTQKIHPHFLTDLEFFITLVCLLVVTHLFPSCRPSRIFCHRGRSRTAFPRLWSSQPSHHFMR